MNYKTNVIFRDPTCLNLNNIFGFILNIPSDYKLGFITLPLHRRHWIAFKQINNLFFNLDSKLNSPSLIGNKLDFIEFLKDELESKEKQLFIVVSADVEREGSWLLSGNHVANQSNSDNDVEVLQLKDIISDEMKVTMNPLYVSNT